MKLKYNKEKNICIIKLIGIQSRDSILHAFDAAVSHINHKSGMGRLWDYCEADFSMLTSDDIQLLAQYSLRFPQGINDVKVAFAVCRDLEYGLTKMLIAFSIRAKTIMEVFRSLQEAEQWLTAKT